MVPPMTSTVSPPVLSGLYRYPIKSTAREKLERVRVGHEGLEGDRRYMLAKPDGTFLTARRHPQLQRISARPVAGGLDITHPSLGGIVAREDEFEAAPFATKVWSDAFEARTTTAALDAWFSEAAGEPVRLLWLGERSPRYSESIDRRLSFADSYPVLLISEGSLHDLNTRTPGPQRMAQFRPNLVIAGTEPYAEDGWRRVRIGSLEFAVEAACGRCAMITVDPTTTEFIPNREPLRTLSGYRRGAKGKILFGQYLVPQRDGELEVGAPLEVLESRDVTMP